MASGSGSENRRPMNTAVDLEIIRKLAADDLVSLIRKFQGNKVMVFDRALAGPTNLIAPPKILESHGVTKILPLETGALPADIPETILFICRPLVHLMPKIVSCIQNEERKGRQKSYHLCFVPQKSLLCTKWLEAKRYISKLSSVEELPLLLFPLDTDVLSLELESTYKEFYVENDPTSMYYIAKALVFLQRKYGIPNSIFGKGQGAKFVYELMQSIQQETGTIKPQIIGAKIENIILIDRQVDLLSPLVTQLTYEGLIDEFYGINCNHVKLPGEKFAEVKNPGDKKTVVLNSSEALYAEMRDKNFSAVGGLLRGKTKEIQDILVQKDTAQSLGEMKRLVQQLPAVNTLKQSISNHTSIAELLKKNTESDDFLSSLECEQELLNGMGNDRVNPHIEDLCSKKAPFLKLLRLLIIQCITCGGLKPKVLQDYERLIIHNYGFEHVLSLRRLNEIGLLKGQSANRAYSVLRRAFNLIVCDGSETTPEDFAYVHSIYAPLSIRLVQHRLKPNLWNSLRESLQSLIPGPTVDEETEISLVQNSVVSVDKNSPKTTLVVFIGGCTYAEISALRFLAQHEDDWEFLVVTTKVINGNTFLTNLFDPLGKKVDAA